MPGISISRLGIPFRRGGSGDTYYSMTLDPHATNIGYIKMKFDVDVLVKITNNGRFYSDAAATLGESTEHLFPAGIVTKRYVKNIAGASAILIKPKNCIEWGETGGNGWYSAGTLKLYADISKFINLTLLNVTGSIVINGSVTGLPLTFLSDMSDLCEISGDISLMTGLERLRLGSVIGGNTITGDLSNLINLKYLECYGNNTLYGDLGVNNVVNGILTSLKLNPCRIITYTAGAFWSNANITINPAVGYGLDGTEVDNMLIDMAASPTLISKTITLMGSNAPRTVASNAAVATLEGIGRTCTVNTNP